jgi:hypothetical protein
VCFYQFSLALSLAELGFELRDFTLAKAGALLLEPHLQSIFLWVFWRQGSHELFAQTDLELNLSRLKELGL